MSIVRQVNGILKLSFPQHSALQRKDLQSSEQALSDHSLSEMASVIRRLVVCIGSPITYFGEERRVRNGKNDLQSIKQTMKQLTVKKSPSTH